MARVAANGLGTHRRPAWELERGDEVNTAAGLNTTNLQRRLVMSGKHSTERGVAYYRRSTTKQEASIPEQRDWARKVCRSEHIELVREFSDDGIPGSDIDQRPDLQEMIRKGRPQGLGRARNQPRRPASAAACG
jgi:hypothetical protein